MVLKTNKGSQESQRFDLTFKLQVRQLAKGMGKSGNAGVQPSPLNMTDDAAWNPGQ